MKATLLMTLVMLSALFEAGLSHPGLPHQLQGINVGEPIVLSGRYARSPQYSQVLYRRTNRRPILDAAKRLVGKRNKNNIKQQAEQIYRVFPYKPTMPDKDTRAVWDMMPSKVQYEIIKELHKENQHGQLQYKALCNRLFEKLCANPEYAKEIERLQHEEPQPLKVFPWESGGDLASAKKAWPRVPQEIQVDIMKDIQDERENQHTVPDERELCERLFRKLREVSGYSARLKRLQDQAPPLPLSQHPQQQGQSQSEGYQEQGSSQMVSLQQESSCTGQSSTCLPAKQTAPRPKGQKQTAGRSSNLRLSRRQAASSRGGRVLQRRMLQSALKITKKYRDKYQYHEGRQSPGPRDLNEAIKEVFDWRSGADREIALREWKRVPQSMQKIVRDRLIGAGKHPEVEDLCGGFYHDLQKGGLDFVDNVKRLQREEQAQGYSYSWPYQTSRVTGQEQLPASLSQHLGPRRRQ